MFGYHVESMGPCTPKRRMTVLEQILKKSPQVKITHDEYEGIYRVAIVVYADNGMTQTQYSSGKSLNEALSASLNEIAE